ncbi:MAG: prealbumin-like fold domain-containing protein, partial [Desulfobulbus sp.]|nr:prealbumin-like fold domain-containing protein [Desulfobulbus sp.]
RAHKGDVVDTITTTASGATTKPLYLGQYKIIETESPAEMVLDSTPHTAVLTYVNADLILQEKAG